MEEHLQTELLRALLFGGLVLLVVITQLLASPKRRGATLRFPPPLGVRFIAWASLAMWALLIIGPLDLGMYWLAALFAPGPLYTIWRWPETISIDEFRIHQSAWCHSDVSMQWNEIASIELSNAGDSLVLRNHSGDRIGVSASQVGADELIAEIEERTGIKCPAFAAASY